VWGLKKTCTAAAALGSSELARSIKLVPPSVLPAQSDVAMAGQQLKGCPQDVMKRLELINDWIFPRDVPGPDNRVLCRQCIDYATWWCQSWRDGCKWWGDRSPVVVGGGKAWWPACQCCRDVWIERSQLASVDDTTMPIWSATMSTSLPQSSE